jgi:polar amino acid transport system substrate-binding protein
MKSPRFLILLLALSLALVAAGCGGSDESGDEASVGDTGAPTETAAADPCAKDQLQTTSAGQLTIGTDNPAFPPWFQDAEGAPWDPTTEPTKEGYEAAVAYAVADELGFSKSQVKWTVVPFNSSYAPGPKEFDFDINQISITPEREKVVDFSDGYYSAAQGVIALKDSPVAGATSIADLADYKLGAQTGTTSLTAIRDVIQPEQEPLVFDDTNVAKQAMENGQVDAILADLPTAFYISAVEIPKSTIVGQFQPTTGEQEEFGMLFEKGSALVPCVNEALAALTSDGTIDQLQQEWLSDVVDVPVLQ